MLGGVWNALKSGASVIKDVACKAADAVVDTAKKVKDKVKSGASKVMSSISGKKHFNEAEQRYNALITRYEDAKSRYRSELEEKTSVIQSDLERINGWKSQVFKELFPKFIQVANRLHHVEINGKHFEEFLADDVLDYKEHAGVQAKQELFEIDFNNMSFKQAALSIITLGFYSRKKAKQSLQQVIDEEKRVEEEIAKQVAQLEKIDQVVSSISNVVEYFESLINGYEKLLKRFEFGVNSQRFLQARNTNFEKLDFRLMPIKHIEDFQALFNLSVVMKTMSTMGYLSESGELIGNDLDKTNAMASHTVSLLAA
ncbi:MAG: DNA repair exonuclease SbcCD ATPase subunit [Oleispira sp.]|jgi:DNA repair exonuclease SbcCD ATPase subunit